VAEMISVVMLEQRKEDRQLIFTALELLVTEIRSQQKAGTISEKSDYWMTPSYVTGVQRKEIMRALHEQPIIREFFIRLFSSSDSFVSEPSASSRPNSRMSSDRGFNDRLKELQESGKRTSGAGLHAESMPHLPMRRQSSWRGNDDEEADDKFLRGIQRSTRSSRAMARPKLGYSFSTGRLSDTSASSDDEDGSTPASQRRCSEGAASSAAPLGGGRESLSSLLQARKASTGSERAKDEVITMDPEMESTLRSMLDSLGGGGEGSPAVKELVANAQQRLGGSLDSMPTTPTMPVLRRKSSDKRVSLTRKGSSVRRHDSSMDVGLKELQIQSTTWEEEES